MQVAQHTDDIRAAHRDAQTRRQRVDDRVPAFLFPYALLRRATVPSARFLRLRHNDTLRAIDEYLDLVENCRTEGPSACGALERVIGLRAPGSDARNRLIALRRDIYNDRLPHSPFAIVLSHGAFAELPAGELGTVTDWLARRTRREHILANAREYMARELACGRRQLRKLFLKREFRIGLATASPSLSHELDIYLNAPEKDAHLSRQVERSLVRYYSRCAMKLSPFSTFLRTSLLRIAETPEARERIRTRRILKLNRAFLGQLTQQIALHEDFRDFVPLRLSPAIALTKNLTYLLRREYNDVAPGRFRIPRETIGVLPSSAVLCWILDHLFIPECGLTKTELVSTLAQQLGHIDRVETYVEKLLQLGVLIPRYDTQMDYILALNGSTCPAVHDLKEGLVQLRSCEIALTGPDQAQRERIMTEAEGAACGTFTAIGKEKNANWKGLLFLEDYIDRGVQSIALPPAFTRPLRDLHNFLARCAILLDDSLFYERNLGALLSTHFRNRRVPLLEFAHWCGDSLLNRTLRSTGETLNGLNPLRLPELEALSHLRMGITEVISSCSTAPELDLRSIAAQADWMRRFCSLGVRHKRSALRFVSCYCQPLAEANGQVSLFVSSLVRGPARPLLRFLGSSGNGDARMMLHRLRDWISEQSPDAEVCEVADCFDFNVNLHPRVTRKLIDYSGHIAASQDGLIRLGDLFVSAGPGGHTHLSIQGSPKEIIPADLGMMADLFQPFVYRLLVILGGAPELSPFLFNPYWWRCESSPSAEVEHFPRLRFGNCILRRRAWSIPRKLLPLRQQNEDDLLYFARVRAWQRSIGLPDRVFCREADARKWMRKLRQRSDRKNWLKHKPEFIHFGNFFLLLVFEKLVAGAERLYIEEMLPDQHSWQFWNMRRPSEFVIDLRCETETEACFE